MEQVIGRLHVPEVTISYGMTETPPICQSSAGAPIEDRITTVGEVMPHMTCRIADPESGRTLPRGVAGELCARGYGVMMGYWNQPDATAAVIDPDGWMHTGDLATMRDDGHIQIVGRIKDLIIRGGEKIQPREIEDVLRGHSAVADAHVIGLPHAAYGEEVCACVTLREGATESPDDLRAYCRGRLALHKVPTHVRLMSTFPTTSTGKVQKGRLREALIAERSRPQASRAGIGELSHGVR
jgi:fatty-acyl-CoA synthase